MPQLNNDVRSVMVAGSHNIYTCREHVVAISDMSTHQVLISMCGAAACSLLLREKMSYLHPSSVEMHYSNIQNMSLLNTPLRTPTPSDFTVLNGIDQSF